MRLSQEWLPIIKRLHHDLTTGVAEDPLDFSDLASKTGILPLAWDMSGFFGVNLEGKIQGISLDALNDPKEVEDERIWNGIIFRGSKVYPELKPLVPDWPYDALECPACHGTGVPVNVPTEIQHRIVCYCGGLGWIPKQK